MTGAGYQPAGPGITDPACREVLEAVREARPVHPNGGYRVSPAQNTSPVRSRGS